MGCGMSTGCTRRYSTDGTARWGICSWGGSRPFWSIRDASLLEVCRYVELSLVRAGMVGEPAAWPWSSYYAHVGEVEPPAWLDTDGLHGYLLWLIQPVPLWAADRSPTGRGRESSSHPRSADPGYYRRGAHTSHSWAPLSRQVC